MTDKERELFTIALAKWGYRNQSDQCQEELSELSIELHKIRRCRNTGLGELAGEIADVSIMLDQLLVSFGPELEKLVSEQRGFKVLRLWDRVTDPEHKGN